VGDLKHNKELSVLAQRWADHLGSIKALKHSEDTYKGQQLGENVASKWSSEGADYTGERGVKGGRGRRWRWGGKEGIGGGETEDEKGGERVRGVWEGLEGDWREINIDIENERQRACVDESRFRSYFPPKFLRNPCSLNNAAIPSIFHSSYPYHFII
jgi:hypothetical protein